MQNVINILLVMLILTLLHRVTENQYDRVREGEGRGWVGRRKHPLTSTQTIETSVTVINSPIQTPLTWLVTFYPLVTVS